MLEFLQSLTSGQWTILVIALLSLIQIVPIKINPWSWLGKQVGRVINKEVMDKQDQFLATSQEYRKKNDLQIKKLESKLDKQSAEGARNRILRFGDEVKNKQLRHSEEYYNQILADITDYGNYCKEHPDFQNERTVVTTKIIKEAYEEHVKNNDFL
ncbi:MAG: hypothetical protein K5656_10175 [Lachnospiraceae bacterium]|nr:hypothetical protein [Lachnospiraceae bacterium]